MATIALEYQPPNLKLRSRSESEASEDSGVLLPTHTEDETSDEAVQKDAELCLIKRLENRVSNILKDSSLNQINKSLTDQTKKDSKAKKRSKNEKCDKENEPQNSDSADDAQEPKKEARTKKRSKTVIKCLEDVATLLLNSDRRKIAIPVKVIERLIFLPDFSRAQSLEVAQASLSRRISGLANIRGALILDNDQARHLDRVKTMIDVNDRESFNALIEMKSDQQVDSAVTTLNRTGESNAIKLATLLKEGVAKTEEPATAEEAVSQPTGRQRSNTISSSDQIKPLKPTWPMSKRHSLHGNTGPIVLPSASLQSGTRMSHSNSSLLRLPIGPGAEGFRPEARLRKPDGCF